MKVISGIYKGRNIEGFNIPGTRPTMDRVKESLFASIQNSLKDATILDLFSGSGSLAIEALSQGAKEAYAVDKSYQAIKAIDTNIKNINVKDCKVIKADYKTALKTFFDQNIKFDLIFLDPPYDTDYIEKSLKLIAELNLIKNEGLIICESNSKDKIIYSDKFKQIKEKKYGDKWVVILEKIC